MAVKENTFLRFLGRNKWKLIITVVVLAAVIAVLAVVALAFMPSNGRIAKGVTMDGISLAGMTVEEARSVIKESGFFEDGFTVTSGGESVKIAPSDIDLEIDEGKSALKAYGIGHSGNFFKKLGDSFNLLTSGIDVAPEPTFSSEKLEIILLDFGIKINGQHQPIQIEDISETEVCVYPPISGQDTNISSAYNAVTEALSSGEYETIEVVFNKKEEKPTVEQLYSMITIEAQNAGYEIKDGEVVIFDALAGRQPSKEEIIQKLPMLNRGEKILLTVTRAQPEITTEMLQAELFGTELASYSSNYASSTANRAFNVNRAANSVNGTILLPDQIFSYNEAIGNPSLANGYKMASVYENGKQTEGVGGGVCQVSSTIYSAVLYANLEIVERRSHSLTVAYVPKGQDATVSYGSVDFKFKNNTGKPIKIDVSAKGGICKVRILGTKPDVERKVELSHSVVGTYAPTDNITYDPNLAEGTRKVTSKGKTGYTIASTRKVFENGALVKTEQLTKSSYKMVPNEVVIGSKAAVTPTPDVTPTPTAKPQETPSPTPNETPPPVTPEATPVSLDKEAETEV